MKRILLIILCFLSACTSVKSISFTSVTRGSRREILVAPGEIRLTEQRMSSDENVTRYPLTREDWTALIGSLKNVELSKIDRLESPTNSRVYDGALASVLAIESKSGRIHQHGFDDANPHEKLKPLLTEIFKLIPGR